MTEESSKEKQSFLSKTWVKVTAGIVGGMLIVGGTFAAGAMAGTKASSAGFDRVFSAVNVENRQHGHSMKSAMGQHQGNDRGGFMFGPKRVNPGMAGLSEGERLDRVNQWLDSLGLEALDELPEEFAGDSEELIEEKRLEMVNEKLERLGLEPLEELPDSYPNS